MPVIFPSETGKYGHLYILQYLCSYFLNTLNLFADSLEIAVKTSLQVRCGDLLHLSVSEKYSAALSHKAGSAAVQSLVKKDEFVSTL